MGTETIFALSSAAGKAGVSVVRVSGPQAFNSLEALTGGKSARPREALYAKLSSGDGGLIDRALVLPFKAPASFTGEDVVEYHIHGSAAVLSALIKALSSQDGHRLAERGEFTRRAFENGKMDLTEAEAIADLIDAETDMQREQALSQMAGSLFRLYEGWRERLIRAMAYIEAVIDFPDEDVPDSETAKVKPDLEILLQEIMAHLDDGRRGERLRDGIRVAILGAPNAGKSSLLNLLARRDIAIVSPMAGTTRDVIEAHLDLCGYPVILADTAGLRPEDVSGADEATHGAVEFEGIKRALAQADAADLKILMFDGTAAPDRHTLDLADKNSIVLFNKSDAQGFDPDSAGPYGGINLSTKTGDGLESFLACLGAKIGAAYSLSRDTPSLTRGRHRAALEDCAAHIRAALAPSLPELMAEDARMAARALGRITGRIDVEDLLDVVFRDFCIGK